MARFTVLDLFSGIGGFALATEWAGGETVAFCENAAYPSEILQAHWPDVPNYGDVTKLCRRIYDCEPLDEEWDEVWCPRCDADFGECECIGTDQYLDTHGSPDVITGGVPCQPASLVGKRHGTSDERWLWDDTLRIFSELQPSYGILENPRSILSLEGGDPFREILGRFACLGYDVQWDVVPASALGAGHRRERLWILLTHANSARLERHAGNGKAAGQAEAGGHPAASSLCERRIADPRWYNQSGAATLAHGLPAKLVRDQLTAIGNSLVPQLAYVWLKTIADKLDPPFRI